MNDRLKWFKRKWWNISNIFFSFPKDANGSNKYELWKHGQSGVYDGQGVIKPTKWYGNQEPFEFEFVVIGEGPGMHKIFDNLELISNKAAPNTFDFEVVGETYDWYELKDLVEWLNDTANQTAIINKYNNLYNPDLAVNLENAFFAALSLTFVQIEEVYPEFIRPFKKEGSEFDNYKFPKLPFIKRVRKDTNGLEGNSSEITIVEDTLLNEDRMHTSQLANDVKKYGRVKGNMMYLEDKWNVEIRPITFKYAYISNGSLAFTKSKETRLRDKYLKIRVKYSGTDLAVIQGIKTSFTLSYS